MTSSYPFLSLVNLLLKSFLEPFTKSIILAFDKRLTDLSRSVHASFDIGQIRKYIGVFNLSILEKMETKGFCLEENHNTVEELYNCFEKLSSNGYMFGSIVSISQSTCEDMDNPRTHKFAYICIGRPDDTGDNYVWLDGTSSVESLSDIVQFLNGFIAGKGL